MDGSLELYNLAQKVCCKLQHASLFIFFFCFAYKVTPEVLIGVHIVDGNTPG